MKQELHRGNTKKGREKDIKKRGRKKAAAPNPALVEKMQEYQRYGGARKLLFASY